MGRKTPKANSAARLSRGIKRQEVMFMRVPSAVKRAIEEAAKHDGHVMMREVPLNEWVVRACIDRIGATFGTSVANQFYRQFFNGLAPIEADIPLPTEEGVTPLQTIS